MSNKKDYKSDFQELTQLILEFREERKWEKYHTPKNLMLGLFVETAELAEYFQYLDGEQLEEHIETFHEDISDELADVLYWVLLSAHQLDVDLVEAFKNKMQKNRQKYPSPKQGMEGEGKIARRRYEKMMAKRESKV